MGRGAAGHRAGTGIHTYLVALVVLTMSPAFVLFMIWSTIERERARVEGEAELLSDAHATAGRLESISFEVQRLMATMSRVPALRASSDAACDLLEGAVDADRRYLALAFAGSDARYICQTLPGNTEDISVADRSWFTTPMGEGRPTQQILLRGRMSGVPAVVLSHPVFDEDGETTGVVAASINLPELLTIAYQMDFSQGVALVDDRRTLVARGDGSDAVDPSLPTTFLGTSLDEVINTVDVGGVPHVVAFVRIESLPGMAVMAVSDEATLLGPRTATFTRSLGLFVLLTMMAVGTGWFATRRVITEPLAALGDKAQAIGSGRFETRAAVTSGARELRALGDAFDGMAAALEQRDDAITDAQTELQETHERLAHAQKMEAVGQLTGGVAHDFNNLLTVIKGCLELTDPTHLAEDDRGLIEQAAIAAQRGADLTHRLLAFSRRQTLAPTTLDLNEIVVSMRPLLSRTLGEETQIVFDLAEPSPLCFADRNQLETALVNLSINARDAMPGGGRLTLRTASWRGNREDLDPGRYAILTVSDEGTGMTPKVAERAIEPFFTTKERGRGTGLGLSGAYGFAKQSHGTLVIDSRTEEGTDVHMYFPERPS